MQWRADCGCIACYDGSLRGPARNAERKYRTSAVLFAAGRVLASHRYWPASGSTRGLMDARCTIEVCILSDVTEQAALA